MICLPTVGFQLELCQKDLDCKGQWGTNPERNLSCVDLEDLHRYIRIINIIIIQYSTVLK